MKYKLSLRLLAGALCCSLLLTACGNGKGKEKEVKAAAASLEKTGEKEYLTMEQAADYLLSAAARYNKKLPEKTELMDNFMGLNKEDKAARLQTLIMVSKAFGELPQPAGNNKRIAPADVDLSGVPEWASAELENLKKSGVLAQSDLEGQQTDAGGEGQTESTDKDQAESADKAQTDGGSESQKDSVQDSVSPEDGKETKEGSDMQSGNALQKSLDAPATVQELENIVRRIYALYGSEPKDDFYSAVNQKELNTKEIPAGETDAGGTYDQTITVQNQINGIIKEVVEGSGYAPGSMEQKIKDFYNSAVDFQKRNALGAEPIRKYLEAIDQAADLKELSRTQEISSREIAAGSLLEIMYMGDSRDTTKKIPTLGAPIEPMNSDTDEEHMIKLLTLCGEKKEEATAHVKAYLELEEAVGKDYQPKESDVRFVTLKELKKLLPGIDVEALVKDGNNQVPKEFCLQAYPLFEKFAELSQDPEYLEGIKTALKLQIIMVHYTNLSKDFLDAFDEYEQKSMGQAKSNSTSEEIAYALVQNTLGTYVDQLYVKRYFSAESKKAVEDLVRQFIQIYKERIEKLDWMGEETKKAAVKKLDSMKFFIGYPDQWDHTLDNLEITDNYFQNQVNALKLFQETAWKEAEEFNSGKGEAQMKIPASVVNAYYDQYSNTMCFPAGILQAPAFDVNASLEENLGGIGTTIAHEISHAFDNHGAEFDENGTKRNWWSKEDYKKFREMCKKTADYYDGFESAPGIRINGEQTLSENIADIGGMACVLEVLKKTENPDYKKFFEAYAKGWLKCTIRARAESLAEVDEHSPSILRVNRVLSDFQEFYDTFSIQPGDGMYVAPEERIQIW